MALTAIAGGVAGVTLLVTILMLTGRTTVVDSPFAVYLFDVGQGDSQLIVFPSGYSILVDCMEASTSSNAMATVVAEKIKSILGNSRVDVAVVTHLHTDHIGMTPKGGMWSLIEQQGITFGKIIDRNAATWTDTNGDGKCTSSELQYVFAGTAGSTTANWECYILNPANTKANPKRELAQMCSTTQIDPPDENAEVTIISADALGAYTSNGEPLAANHVGESKPPSENDYSIGLLVRFGSILYATAGDLTGYTVVSSSYTYNDVETSVAPRVGAVDIMKVSHHGSSHSTNDLWLSTLQPTVSLISCGATNTYGHPSQTVLDKLQNAGSAVYVTERGNPTCNYGKAVVSNADIVIASYDGEEYVVQAGSVIDTFIAKGATPPVCTFSA